MHLIQMSTPWCPPCKMAKSYIESTYDSDYINYVYMDLTDPTSAPDFKWVADRLKPRGVPLFAVINDSEIIYTFSGFDTDEIQKYANYIIRTNSEVIKDSISIERVSAQDTFYEQLIQEIEDIKNRDTINLENFIVENDEDYFLDDIEDEEDEEED